MEPSPLRRRREELGLTREEFVRRCEAFADRLGYEGFALSTKQLGRWEREQPPVPHPRSRNVLRVILGVERLVEVGFPLEADADLADDDVAPGPGSSSLWDGAAIALDPLRMNRRELLLTGGALAAFLLGYVISDGPPAVPSAEQLDAEAESLEACSRELARADATTGSTGVLARGRQAAAAAIELLEHRAAEGRSPRRTLALVAELASFTGWLEFDAGFEIDAQRWLRLGLQAARAADDPQLAAKAMTYMSIQHYNLCNWSDALTLARLGRRVLRGSDCPRLEATLLTREARSLAGAGDRAGCVRAVDQALELLDRGPGADDPSWVDWVTPGEVHGQASGCAVLLGDADWAAREIELAEGAYAPPADRSASLHLLRLGLAHAQSREPELAVVTAERALDLGEAVASYRFDEVKGDLLAALRPFGDVRAVRSFLDRRPALTVGSLPRSSRERLLAGAGG